MNTARQLLWLEASREEKYKAKQAIDTFFVRGGDVLSAGVVLMGTRVLHLTVAQFAMANVVLTVAWIGVALLILKPSIRLSSRAGRRLAAAMAMLALLVLPAKASAQESREAQLAAQQAVKAQQVHPYEPDRLERGVAWGKSLFVSERPVYAYMGSVLEGGGLAVGPGYRGRFAESGAFDVHGAWSIRGFKTVTGNVRFPSFADGRVALEAHGSWRDAPRMPFYGTAQDPLSDDRSEFAYSDTTIGVGAQVKATRFVSFGGGVDAFATRTESALDPTYQRTKASVAFDWRDVPGIGRRGGLYRVDWYDYRQTNSSTDRTAASFRRVDAEARQYIPLLRENWILAFRTLASTTMTDDGNAVPFFLLPELGGSSTLRGYPSWRLRGRNRMAVTGEYRWTAGPFVDMAVFYDTGTVAERFNDLSSSRWLRSYGIGTTFHTFEQSMVRLYYARTTEGHSISIGFSPSF
jgi:hypothetical protein